MLKVEIDGIKIEGSNSDEVARVAQLILRERNTEQSIQRAEARTESRVSVFGYPTLRHAAIGDVFKFKKPPPGWTSGNILVVDKMPGYAAPEGCDYLPISLLDGEIEWVEGPHCELKGQCEDTDGSGSCKGCGRWLGALGDDRSVP